MAAGGGGTVPLRYELRSAGRKPWVSMRSWALSRNNKSGSCQLIAPEPASNGACVVRAEAEVRSSGADAASAPAEATAATVTDGPEAYDQGEVAAGRCRTLTRAGLAPAAAAGASTRIGRESMACTASRVSLAEMLEATPVVPQFGCATDADASGGRPCFVWHDGLNDGWGAQAFRRAMLFLAATQGGCTYLHNPVAPMNAPSRRHGVSHTAAEAFFGLGHGCATAQRETATALRVRNGSAAPFLVRTAGCSGWVQVPSTLPGYSPPHPPPWTT